MAPHWIATVLGLQNSSQSQVEITVLTQGYGELQHGLSIDGHKLRIGDKVFFYGLGTHCPSEIRVALPNPGQSFRAVVGVDNNSVTNTATEPCQIEFSIEIDGVTVWKSPILNRDSEPFRVDVPLNGAQTFVLKAREVEGKSHAAHADWAATQVELENGTLLHLGLPAQQSLPLSFRYGGRPSSEFLSDWQKTVETQVEGENTIHRVSYLDPETGLEFTVEMTQFPDFEAAEWVAYFKNTSQQPTPIIEEIRSLDLNWAASGGELVLHRSRGSHAIVEDFMPVKTPLYRAGWPEHYQSVEMVSPGGRSSEDWLPFFNLQDGNSGVFSALGWSGDWKAEFRCEKKDEVVIRQGFKHVHLSLLPGEQIRTPRALLLFWQGNLMAAHNTFRRFILKYHTPHHNGKPALAPICAATWGGMKTASHLERVRLFQQHGIKYDCYWVDAGWYGNGLDDCPDVFVGDWPSQVGNWNINRYRHPEGLRPLSEAANQAGMSFLLWFEPERAISGTQLPTEHPDWFKEGGQLLLDLGNEEARAWLVELLSGYITEQGLGWYRQDFNMAPNGNWASADAPNRQGISEIRHMEGLYALWDELLQRHPGLMIDNCASGGRRLDLETIGRSIALWRSDQQCFPNQNPIGAQMQTIGLSHWLPLHTGGNFMASIGDTYSFRSSMAAGIADQTFMYESDSPPTDYDWDWHRARIDEQNRIRPSFYGDFYPLTSESLTVADDAWCIYQMFNPETRQGFIMALRREKSLFREGIFPLHGLEADRTYTLEDADSGDTWEASGAELLTTGLAVVIPQQRQSRLIYIK